MSKKSEMMDRVQTLANEIAQIFCDAEHWNRVNPDQPINPDPDRELETTYRGLCAMLAKDPNYGRRLVMPIFPAASVSPEDSKNAT